VFCLCVLTSYFGETGRSTWSVFRWFIGSVSNLGVRQSTSSTSVYFALFLDDLCGNFDILISNIVILAASSIESTFGHSTKSAWSYFSAISLGFWFLFNQVAELNSYLAVFSGEGISLVLASLVTHLSHLILSLILFLKVFIENVNVEVVADNVANFVSSYWHLVELVWIVILLALLTV
jgi:heme/copper-type cytochrome/quinol oxidase subunit 3